MRVFEIAFGLFLKTSFHVHNSRGKGNAAIDSSLKSLPVKSQYIYDFSMLLNTKNPNNIRH